MPFKRKCSKNTFPVSVSSLSPVPAHVRVPRKTLILPRHYKEIARRGIIVAGERKKAKEYHSARPTDHPPSYLSPQQNADRPSTPTIRDMTSTNTAKCNHASKVSNSPSWVDTCAHPHQRQTLRPCRQDKDVNVSPQWLVSCLTPQLSIQNTDVIRQGGTGGG